MNTIIIINQNSNCLKNFFGRPFLEHVIEALIERYINEIHLFYYEHPDKVLTIAGNGEKWGSTINHHHIENQNLSEFIKLNINTKEMTLMVNPDYIVKPDYKHVNFQKGFNTLFFYKNYDWLSKSYTGWGLFTPDLFQKLFFNDLDDLNNKLCYRDNITEVVTDLLSIVSYKDWLDSANKILRNKSGIILKCRETENGIFKGRNVSIGKKSIINAPVYLGDNTVIGSGTVIGPFASIGKNCRIDDNTIIKNSLIESNSYIGRSLNIQDSVIDDNRIVNTELASEVEIKDEFYISNFLYESDEYQKE
ncbi:MAG: NDP-sugar synthase [Deltaproteobacteria bacterium]|nr:NDP-sugar synthase [Deltaproteobacteria bacterium]